MNRLVYRSPIGGPRKFAQWLLDLRGKSGAYVIKSNRGTVLYVGESHSGRLPDTIKRHFHRWRDCCGREHFVYDPDGVSVAAVVCPPPSAVGCQNNLIRRLSPRDNTNGFVEPDPF